MTRKSLVYNYHPIETLPPSNHKTGFIDTLDAAIEGLWTPEIKALMQPIGHPASKRFFIQQYKAAQLIKEGASAAGLVSLAKADDWALMSALKRVAHRRGIAPRQLLTSAARASDVATAAE
jgi:hypothetical protein